MIRCSHAITCLMGYHNKKRTEATSIVLQAKDIEKVRIAEVDSNSKSNICFLLK